MLENKLFFIVDDFWFVWYVVWGIYSLLGGFGLLIFGIILYVGVGFVLDEEYIFGMIELIDIL